MGLEEVQGTGGSPGDWRKCRGLEEVQGTGGCTDLDPSTRQIVQFLWMTTDNDRAGSEQRLTSKCHTSTRFYGSPLEVC